jgi:hypothetical protein
MEKRAQETYEQLLRDHNEIKREVEEKKKRDQR